MTGRKAIIIFCSWKLLSLSLECTWSYKNMKLAHKSYFCIWYLYLFSLILCNNIYEWRYIYKACRKRLMFFFFFFFTWKGPVMVWILLLRITETTFIFMLLLYCKIDMFNRFCWYWNIYYVQKYLISLDIGASFG